MAATYIRLLTLTALMLMPFTLASGPAMARHHQAMAGMAADHGVDHSAHHQQGNRAPDLDMTQCLLMCAALPAAGPQPIASPDLPRAPLRLAIVPPIHGIILEIATPPPRTT